MNKEQIEEMRKTIKQGFQKADCRVPYTNEPYPYFDSQINYIAKSLYDAGYRKASDGATVLLVGKYNQALDEKTIEYFIKYNEQIRKETAKEFAEKLKEKVHNYYPSIDSYCTSRHVILVKDIDELLKEYEEEE